VTARYRYRAFGERLNLDGPDPARLDPSFQGRTYDAGLNLYDYRNRTYDPSTGRFLQRDPVLGGDEAYNLYAFPGSNPVMNLDPMGEYLVAKSKAAIPYVQAQLGDLDLKVGFAARPQGGYVVDLTNNAREAVDRALDGVGFWSKADDLITLALDQTGVWTVDGSGRVEKLSRSGLLAGAKVGAARFGHGMWNMASFGILGRVEQHLAAAAPSSAGEAFLKATGSAVAQAANVATVGMVDKAVDRLVEGESAYWPPEVARHP